MADVIKGSGIAGGAPQTLTDSEIAELRRDLGYPNLTLAERLQYLGDRVAAIVTVKDVISIRTGQQVVRLHGDDQTGHLSVSSPEMAEAWLIPMRHVTAINIRPVRS